MVLGTTSQSGSDGSGTASKLSTGLFKDNSYSVIVFYVERDFVFMMCVYVHGPWCIVEGASSVLLHGP